MGGGGERDIVVYCHKLGQCQPGTYLAGLTFPMLNTKYQRHWPSGSREKIFEELLHYLDMVAILVT